jgi:uncharacterized protein DUF4214
MLSACRRAFAAAALCFLVSLGLLCGPARSAPPAKIVWGANGHPFTAYGGVTYDEQLAFLADLGLKSYRVNISEMRSAAALDALITKAAPLGITILPVLTPSLDLDSLPPEKLRMEAQSFAKAMVSRFKDRIKVWELGNELENYAIIKACEMQDDGKQYNCAWGPAGGTGVLDYYGPRWAKSSAVLKGLSEGVIAADPSARKAIGTAGWGHTGAFERMRQDGIKWDISVWHMYGEDPEWAFKALAAYGHPIWVTEMNHPEGSAKGERQQAVGLRRWMERLNELSARYPVEAVHIYELLDETYWAPDNEAVMGLVRLERNGDDGWRPGSPKAAYDSVRAVLRGEPETGPTGPVKRDCDLDRMADNRSPPEAHVAYLYCLLLSRAPDGGGLHSWTANRRAGASISSLLEAMAGSPEFETRYRTGFLSDDRFVYLAYRLLLGRDPDGHGRTDYTAALREGRITRPGLIGAIAASEEFRERHKMLFQS